MCTFFVPLSCLFLKIFFSDPSNITFGPVFGGQVKRYQKLKTHKSDIREVIMPLSKDDMQKKATEKMKETGLRMEDEEKVVI